MEKLTFHMILMGDEWDTMGDSWDINGDIHGIFTGILIGDSWGY